jgi:hypothetical protein
VDKAKQAELEGKMVEHEKANPTPIIKTLDGKPLTDSKGKPLPKPRLSSNSAAAARMRGRTLSRPKTRREQLEVASALTRRDHRHHVLKKREERGP